VLAVKAAEDIALRRPLHIVADKKIEQAVAVVIEPERRCAECHALAQTAGIGHVDKSALAGIVEEPVLSHAGDENVREAVIVIISDGHAHTVHFNIQAGVRGDVGEGAISVVAIETQRGVQLLVAGPIHSIDQKNILPAVAVVVEKGAARTHSFGQKLPTEGAAVVLELNAGAGGYIHKSETGCRRWPASRFQSLQQR
jgi:hypothetical protein